MERQIGMETALFGGPPNLEDLVKKANGQIAFMNIFALPLFDGVADLLPDMTFAANEIRRNQAAWQKLIDREKAKELPIESRPTEEEISQQEASEGYYTKHSEEAPASWKEPSDLPQYDGSEEDREKLGASHGCMPSYPQPTTGVSAGTGADNHKKGWNTEAASGSSPQIGTRRGTGQNQRSSGRHHHNGSAGVRTQSTSTYTNNTTVTPVSSTTQASSVVSADSGHDAEKKDRRAKNNTHADFVANGQQKCDQHGNGKNQDKSSNFMSNLLDKSFDNGNAHGITLKDPTSAPSNNTNLSNSPAASPPVSQSSNTSTSGGPGRTIPRRRSRLRLAFWRRNRQPYGSPPH